MKKYRIKARSKVIIEKVIEIGIPKDDDIADYRDDIEDLYLDPKEGKIVNMDLVGSEEDLYFEVV